MGQAISHMSKHAYGCFRQDLTKFAADPLRGPSPFDLRRTGRHIIPPSYAIARVSSVK